MDTNNGKIFYIGQCFNIYTEFSDQQEKYEEQTGCKLSVKYSKGLQNTYEQKPNVKYNSQLDYDEICLHCVTPIMDPILSKEVKCQFRLSVRTSQDEQSLIVKRIFNFKTKKNFFDHTHLKTTITNENIEEQNNGENVTTEEHVHSTTAIVNKKIEEDGNTEEDFTTESTQIEKNQHFDDFHILLGKLKENIMATVDVEERIKKLNEIQEFNINIEQLICSTNITFSEFMLPAESSSHSSTSKSLIKITSKENLRQLKLSNIDDSSTSESSIGMFTIDTVKQSNINDVKIPTENLPQLKLSNIDDPLVSSSIDVNTITFAQKSSRGRPKGSSTRAIGLPKNFKSKIGSKQKSSNKELEIKNFKYLTETEKKLKILLWIFPEVIVTKAMNTNDKINDQDMQLVSVNNIADRVASCNIKIIEQHFEQQAFNKLREIIKEKNRNGPWTCQHCKEALSEKSIECDACLNWYDFHCMDLKKKPKSASWFCKACNKKIKNVF